MHRTKTATKIGASAAIAAAALIATATGASAATLNDAGSGFVGKGEVQSAFGWNNAKMQTATAEGFTFSTTQDAEQAYTQDASQVVTQDARLDLTRTVSCFIDGKQHDFSALGHRDGSREGIRTGERTGVLKGTLKGSLASEIAYDKKGKTGQWTGFYLKNYLTGDPRFAPAGTVVWEDEAEYGVVDYSGAVATLGEIEWTGWQSEPGENPADCLRNDKNQIVTNLVDNTVEDPAGVQYGDEHFGAESFTNQKHGDPVGTGPVSLFVTYGTSTKPLTITAPLV